MALEWLEARVPGFQAPRGPAFDEITAFFWLWTYFEFKCLNRRVNSKSLRKFIGGLHAKDRLDSARFAPSVKFVRERFYQNDKPSPHYQHLKLEKHYSKNEVAMIRAMLSGDGDPTRKDILGLFLVIYRLRNNHTVRNGMTSLEVNSQIVFMPIWR